MFSKIGKLLTTKRTHTVQTGNERDDNVVFFEYYIVFKDSDGLGYPWRWFTREGFRHCSLYYNLDGKTFNITQSLFNIRTYLYGVNIHEAGDILAQDETNTVIYKPVFCSEKYKNTLGTFLPTCVSLCQRITGLTYHAITPYSYYKKLLKDGGIIVGGKPKTNKALEEQQAKQLADAQKREAEAKAAQADLKKRQRLGRKSLLGTVDGELGVM